MKRLMLLLVLAACSKRQADPGPTCAEVVDHMIPVMQKGLAGHEQLELGNRKLMIDQCEARKMSKERRTCLVQTRTLEDLAKCRDPNDPGPVQIRRPSVMPGSGQSPGARP